MKNTKLLLVLIYITLSSVILFRVAVHPLHYTTPDSVAYLKQSDFIKQKWSNPNISFINRLNVKEKFSTWPIGYPLSIAIVSTITNTSSLYASKIVNLIFLELIFMLLYRWFGNQSWFISLSLFSYGTLEVLSETWSETPFVFFVLLLAYIVINEHNLTTKKRIISLLVTLLSLFIFRYVGLIYVGIIGLITFNHIIQKKVRLGLSYGIPFVISLLLIGLYLYHNVIATGFITGMEREALGHQGIGEFTKLLAQGLFNEFSIARNYFFVGRPDLLFLGMLALQIVVMFFVFKHRSIWLYQPNSSVKILTQFSFLYLFGMILLKIFIPIDEFDFRILAPFTIPVLIGLFALLSNIKHSKPIILFMILSLIVNLPKGYIMQMIAEFT